MAGRSTAFKVIIQAVRNGDLPGAPPFRLIAYEVETLRTYNPKLFDTLGALLDATAPVISGLRKKIPQPSGQSSEGVIFNEVLWLTAEDVSRLGLAARTR